MIAQKPVFTGAWTGWLLRGLKADSASCSIACTYEILSAHAVAPNNKPIAVNTFTSGDAITAECTLPRGQEFHVIHCCGKELKGRSLS